MAASIAVVIPSHNRPAELRVALESLRAQSAQPDEVIVIDDGSQTALREGVLEVLGADVRARLLRNEAPRGANAARNMGVAAATADFVAFLDDDDEFAPGKLASIQAAIAANPGADIVHHGARVVYDNQSVSYLTRVHGRVSFEALLTGNKVGGMSLACVRRGLLADLGGFDEQLPALQDWDLWLRSAQRGAKFVAIDEPLTTYHFTTGKVAISKSLDRLERAMALIDAKFAKDIAALTDAQRRARRRTDVGRYAHRMSMNGRNGAAALTYLKGGLATGSLKLLAAAPVALLGIRSLAMLRRLGG